MRAREGATLLGVDTEHSLRAVLEQALAEGPPDAVVVTGDVAHDPVPATYQRARRIVSDYHTGPALWLAGNHDVASAMGSLLERTVLDVGAWSVLALDSHVDDTVEAHVSAAHWRCVQRDVAERSERWMLVATHHPPVTLDCPWLDAHRIKNGAELLQWLFERPSVAGMVFGHAHQVVDLEYQDRTRTRSLDRRALKVMGTPSTCFQFAPGTRAFAIDDTGPGYRWLGLHADGRVESTVHRVRDYPLHIDLDDR